jgi:flavin reductase (DIM6/NTAB) family NADH-FMN oxidoreductase RutF
MQIDPQDLNWYDSHELLTNMVTPRPIAFVSTIGKTGVYNLAPYSYFTALCNTPMVVGFAQGRKGNGRKKDTLRNIESSREFVINVVTEDLAERMVQTSSAYPPGVDEFVESGLTPAKAALVNAPLLAESPISMECRLLQILGFGKAPRKNEFVIGEVVRVHIKDDVMAGGALQPLKLKMIGRLGGHGRRYCRTTDIFDIKRTHWLDAIRKDIQT